MHGGKESGLLRGSRRRQTEHHVSVPANNAVEYVPSPADYPTFPPPPPSDILQTPEEYWAKVSARKFAAPRGVFEDSSLYALYRLYEFVILDKVFDYRNALEAFWRQHQWIVQQIPDPKDDNPARISCFGRHIYFSPDFSLELGCDLTQDGSFDEVQAGLNWLSSQPHRYKILIAGNHDVLSDEAFLAKNPERPYGQTKTKEHLDWGTVLYLQDTCVTLDFSRPESQATTASLEPRKLTIFGSPWTPQYGISAFQYGPSDESHWTVRFADLNQPDIFVTHGPPKHHLDARDFHRAGCPYLAEGLARFRPRLVVFGHIHASYGREDVVLDTVQREYEKVMTGWGGWQAVGWMAVLVLWARLEWLFGVRQEKVTTFVNAAVVDGPQNGLKNNQS
ncbi:uncharacterized protein PAC_12784 [Phialocephala subalpina]|uniref:Calcineurin-like phosphoesterase domain-containing protein n=1 Tax=Phialocephala subalpina TaxID=576137 RepID=A0A1L7XD45_9HELO|nr:uncharacterized protein PAC_12784 [Phialocephala subalpina]